MEITPALMPRSMRWALYAALWMLLCTVFGSQLYLAGYVTPWSRAVASEAVYWLSWWLLAPAVFWWCRRLRFSRAWLRLAALFAGAALVLLLAPLAAHGILWLLVRLGWCFGPCEPLAAVGSPEWRQAAVRAAGVNLPVYAGFVLAWHANAYYRESRERQLRAAQLESRLNQARLDALRSQLNPHFLFNSLHSIAELVHTDPALAEQLILRLGELLRRVLETTRHAEITLEQELDFIRAYVDIEQMRLGPRLRVAWQVDAAALPARVPSLILQPLVENAVQHGIAARAGGGTLTLRAQRREDWLEIDIGDDGPGVPAGRPEGIGISNTRARLRAAFGAAHGFELQQRGGLVVSLKIPVTA